MGSIMRLGEEGLIKEIRGIPTGCPSLDLALGGKGLPRGRIVEIFGPESSGKTTLALSIVANAQREGGVAAFIDAEHALDLGVAPRRRDELVGQLARAWGVDASALEALRLAKPANFGKADEQAVYDLAQELLTMREVSEETYGRSRSALGERGILDVVAVLGYYSLIAMSMKTFAQEPEGVRDPFAGRGR